MPGGYELLGGKMAAMAGAAGDGLAGVGDHADVVGVDLLGHFVHEASGLLLFLGVVGEVEHGATVGADLGFVDGVAGAAAAAELALPLLHDGVDLLAGEVFGQDLEVGGRGRALALSRAVRAGEAAFRAGERGAERVADAARRELESAPGVRVDYVAVVDWATLEPVERVEAGCLLAVAAWVGQTRLLDNAILG